MLLLTLQIDSLKKTILSNGLSSVILRYLAAVIGSVTERAYASTNLSSVILRYLAAVIGSLTERAYAGTDLLAVILRYLAAAIGSVTARAYAGTDLLAGVIERAAVLDDELRHSCLLVQWHLIIKTLESNNQFKL